MNQRAHAVQYVRDMLINNPLLKNHSRTFASSIPLRNQMSDAFRYIENDRFVVGRGNQRPTGGGGGR